MSETKWTPLPWHNRCDDFIESEMGVVVVEQINNDPAEVPDEQITGNANLIAAAPELYKALDMALYLLHKVGWSNPEHPIWTIGPAALAKARGEAPRA